ncbi:uncharacterized protein tnfrsf13b isoform X2 [Nelusetta ayraudi]|uniref:uncharacterized protein tnfrsf13b isoform X2 n=1 Tax=Nelusetta ayraudi TaxID=303726 RepID=UPI003F70FAD0
MVNGVLRYTGILYKFLKSRQCEKTCQWSWVLLAVGRGNSQVELSHKKPSDSRLSKPTLLLLLQLHLHSPAELMARKCLGGQYWDSLVRGCAHCHENCQQATVIASCHNYCESLKCKSGQYYDRLLKTCVSCSAICSQHPPECSEQTTPLTPLTTEAHPVTTLAPCSSVLMCLDNSTLLVYSLLAVSLLLLLLSLSLALGVFLRGDGAKTPEPRPQEGGNAKESVIQHVQEDGQPPQSSKETAPNYSYPTEQEPSDDSIPTETCVCVHCFPDLKSVVHSGERPYVLYPNLLTYKTPAQNDTAHQTEVNFAEMMQGHAAVR